MIYTVTFNPAIDYVVRLDRPLEVGEVNRAAGEDCVLGGKGINVSGVLRELGCESVALGFVAGETGAWLERGLAAQGLRTDFIHLAFPILPAWKTCAPARPNAVDWFKPFPPLKMFIWLEEMVSPFCTKWSTLYT